ncbi:MAG: hypothetical protein HFI10_08610 [Lachnospiraceae bacterium]|nr:hypothetical protein [Lachnospiraceae bacterium]
MDKQEYKIRSEEIRTLVEEKNYREAADIADTIDWRRVKSVKMLCTISDIYKMVRRYEDSKTILEMAYEKRPGSRMIVFALTELCLKLGDVVNAWEYYKEFCQVAPDDSRKYILLYKVYAAQEVSLEEQIKVLEKLKEEEYIDRWVYELAYLYHKIGFGTKCVEECDEMILWLGEGRYVRKAMELKMLHEPLTPKQQAVYNGEKRFEIEQGDTQVIPNLDAAMVKENEGRLVSEAPTVRLPVEDLADIQVKILDDSPYNTMNLQKELAADMKRLMEGENQEPIWEGTEPLWQDSQNDDFVYGQEAEEGVSYYQEDISEEVLEAEDTEALFDGDEEETINDTGEIFIQDTPEEEEEAETDHIMSSLMAPMLEETQEIPPVPDMEEVFFEDPNTVDMSGMMSHPEIREAAGDVEIEEVVIPEEEPEAESVKSAVYEEESSVSGVSKVIVPADPGQGVLRTPGGTMQPADFAVQKTGFDDMLSQEADGQISLVVPEKEAVEKQITGQMSIQDILLEWEQMKKNKEAQLKDTVQKSVLDSTGDIFAEFEASKDALLRELEKTAKEAQIKEAEKAAAKELLAEEPVYESEEVLPEPESEDAEPVYTEPESEEEAEEESEKEPLAERNLPEELRPALNDRALSPEEKELFESFVRSRKSRGQLLHVLDNMSLAAYTGNVLITGEEDAGTINFARNLVRDLQISDSNFSGRAAKITGRALNKKEPGDIIDKLKNGALIVVEAGGMNCSTAEALVKALQTESKGIIVMLVDTKGAINSLLEVNAVLNDPFNTRIDIEALNDDALVAYGKKFAYDREYAIDEMGVLALHTRIADMQTAEHSVTTSDVRRLVKEAIQHANKKTPGHFFDVLFGKRYDHEDMIVLREEDFFYYA